MCVLERENVFILTCASERGNPGLSVLELYVCEDMLGYVYRSVCL